MTASAVALRSRLILVIGLTLTVGLLAASTPDVAGAACGSSTPAAFSAPDPVPDNEQPGFGPEVVSVDASLDSACRLMVEPKILAPLGANEFSVILLDLDPSTGDRSTEIPDVKVYIYPGVPAILEDRTGA
jgi:hypothetical protein